ncbi:hypothetical protein HaLaN_06741, partial [Haematococcus lacustris]
HGTPVASTASAVPEDIDATTSVVAGTGQNWDINCTATFSSLLNGFAAVFGPGALEQLRLQYKASIDHIERDTAFQ